MEKTFRNYLSGCGLAENTVKAYMLAVNLFFSKYDEITASNLEDHKRFLVSRYKTQTVNLNIIGLNRYLSFLNKKKLCLHVVKRQQATVLRATVLVHGVRSPTGALRANK